MKVKIVVSVIMMAIFFIANWLWDIFHNFADMKICSLNGFDAFQICNCIAGYHVAWYVSIAMYIFLMIMYLVEVKK